MSVSSESADYFAEMNPNLYQGALAVERLTCVGTEVASPKVDPTRAAVMALKERLRTHCQIDGVPVSVEEFETTHKQFALGAE